MKEVAGPEEFGADLQAGHPLPIHHVAEEQGDLLPPQTGPVAGWWRGGVTDASRSAMWNSLALQHEQGPSP